MDQRHAWWSGRDSILATVPKKRPWLEVARAQLPRPRHRRAEASWPIDQVRFSGTVRTLRRLGGDGRLQMNSKWTKLAAAGALSLCTAVSALAGSVTQPGETVGLNAGTPLAPGWYAINTVDWGCRNTPPTHTCTGLTIPVVAWSTPWTFWGARFQLLAAWPAVEAGVQRSLSVNPDLNLPGTYFNGMYNPAV